MPNNHRRKELELLKQIQRSESASSGAKAMASLQLRKADQDHANLLQALRRAIPGQPVETGMEDGAEIGAENNALRQGAPNGPTVRVQAFGGFAYATNAAEQSLADVDGYGPSGRGGFKSLGFGNPLAQTLEHANGKPIAGIPEQEYFDNVNASSTQHHAYTAAQKHMNKLTMANRAAGNKREDLIEDAKNVARNNAERERQTDGYNELTPHPRSPRPTPLAKEPK